MSETPMAELGTALKENRAAQVAEITCVFLPAFAVAALVMANGMSAPQAAAMSVYIDLQEKLPMLLPALAGAYPVLSFGEEVICRGLLITRLVGIGRHGNPARRIAVATSAVVFGPAHFSWGIIGVAQTMFMGLALGIAYLVTKRNLRVLALALAHFDNLLLPQMHGVAPASTTGQAGCSNMCMQWTAPASRQMSRLGVNDFLLSRCHHV
jgi:membrane protease YdiL (CAAX protease family)